MMHWLQNVSPQSNICACLMLPSSPNPSQHLLQIVFIYYLTHQISFTQINQQIYYHRLLNQTYYIVKVEMAEKFDAPFFHMAIPNFLPEGKYNTLFQLYNKFKFFEKDSDLFHFFQTNQLNAQPSLDFFKQSLSGQFSKLCDMTDTSYNIFASYYFEGDYLLCHDDVIEDRKYAFSYYLEDHPSGELVLYDSTATKAVKSIKVTNNLLVIFQVSNISFHEVAYCSQNGRKAVTGWLNIKGQGEKRQAKKIENFKQNLPEELLKYPLDVDLEEEEFYHFPEIEYCFDATETSIAGPFFEKKAKKLTLENTVVFDLKGYELFSADFYKFEVGDYVLLNDSINTLGDGGDILDVFIVQLSKKTKNSDESIIQIVDEKGNTSGIPSINNSVFMIHRNEKNYFVSRAAHEFFLGHLIYKRVEKSKKPQQKTKEHQKSKEKVMAIRRHLINTNKQQVDINKRQTDALKKTKDINKKKNKPTQGGNQTKKHQNK